MKEKELDWKRLAYVILDEEDLVANTVQVEVEDVRFEIETDDNMELVSLASGQYVAVPSIFLEYLNQNGDWKIVEEEK